MCPSFASLEMYFDPCIQQKLLKFAQQQAGYVTLEGNTFGRGGLFQYAGFTIFKEKAPNPRLRASSGGVGVELECTLGVSH